MKYDCSYFIEHLRKNTAYDADAIQSYIAELERKATLYDENINNIELSVAIKLACDKGLKITFWDKNRVYVKLKNGITHEIISWYKKESNNEL